MAAWNRIVYCLLKFTTKKLVRVTILRGMLNASSGRCRAHPAVEHLWSLQPTFNDDVDASVNFQFRVANTFRPCYFTPKADFVIIFHRIDYEFINREKCHLLFTKKQKHLFSHMKVSNESHYTNLTNRQEVKDKFYADVAKLLKKNGYPPKTIDNAYDEIMKQEESYKQYTQ